MKKLAAKLSRDVSSVCGQPLGVLWLRMAALALLLLGAAEAPIHASSTGQQCEVPTTNPALMCGSGTACRPAIKNSYCALQNKTCGWSGTQGFNTGDIQAWQGRDYVCTGIGFRLARGERCQLGSSAASDQCVLGDACKKAISNRYCSASTMVCGWPGEPGTALGAKRQYNGKQYVCTVSGFKEDTAPTQTAVDAFFQGLNDVNQTLIGQLGTWKTQAQQAATKTAAAWGGCPSSGAQSAYDQIENRRDGVQGVLDDAYAMKTQAEAAHSNCKATFAGSPMCDTTYNTLDLHATIATFETAKQVLNAALTTLGSLECVGGCQQTASVPVPFPELQSQGKWPLSGRGWVRGEVCTELDLGRVGFDTGALASGNLAQLIQAELPRCGRRERFAICTRIDEAKLLEQLQRAGQVPAAVRELQIEIPDNTWNVPATLAPAACQRKMRVCKPGGNVTISVNEGAPLFDGTYTSCSGQQDVQCASPPYGLKVQTTAVAVPDLSRTKVSWRGRSPGSKEIDLTKRPFEGICQGGGPAKYEIPKLPKVVAAKQQVPLPLCTQPTMIPVVANP